MEQQQQMNSGLTRYRSAPSSYFAELTSSNFYGEVADQYININPRASSPDSDRFFSRFVSSCGGEGTSLQNTCDMRPETSFVNEQVQGQYMAKHEPDVSNLQQQIAYNQSQSHQLDHKKPAGLVQSVVNNSFNNVGSSMGMDNLGQMKMAGGSNSNLIRQSSSPAGLFAQVNIDNAGYAVMRGMGKSDAASNIPAKALASSGSRLNNQIEFPPDTPSLSGRRPPHAFKAEAKSYGGAAASPESGSYGESAGVYLGGDFGHTSWNDSPLLSDNFLAGIAENDRTNYSALHSSSNQISEGRSRPSTILAHHLSLPTSSAELSAVEKLWQHSDSVPMKTRAKRGYATHPRSIAERVRRTKISERMRKLQDLVPNMDKQTNTADMLDLSVEYIKDLQKQVKTLSDLRAKCTCSNKQQKIT